MPKSPDDPIIRSPDSSLAERRGFEPLVPFGYTRFPSVLLKPLGHLSGGAAENMTVSKMSRGDPQGFGVDHQRQTPGSRRRRVRRRYSPPLRHVLLSFSTPNPLLSASS